MKAKMRMVVGILFCILCVGMLWGCGKKKETKQEVKTEPEPPKVEHVLEEPVEPEPTPIPENENILTGVGDLSKEAIGKRPVAVMVNNIEPALPQYGIGQADLIFEIPVEGSLTRFMALYGDYTKVPKICPIRSCRYYFPALAKGFDAYYVHWGSDQTILGYVNGLGIDRYDGMSNALGLFGRDRARRSQGYALEHTGYFDGTGFAKAIQKKGVRTKLKKSKAKTAFSFCGMDEVITPGGKETKSVYINFGASNSSFVYKEDSKVYVKKMNGHKHKDGKTGESLKFTNVIVLETSIGIKDAKGHRTVDWKGGKKAVGYYMTNGKRQKISWSKKNEGADLKFYKKNGEELVLNRGKTYIAFTTPGQIQFN